MDENENNQDMIQSTAAYWQSIRGLPPEDAQYATLLHLWTHARWFVGLQDYELMIIRPLAYMTLMREGCPPKEIPGRVADRMWELQQTIRAEEQRKRLQAETGAENIVPFSGSRKD